MDRYFEIPLNDNEAALWSLGQAGYVVKSMDRTVVIDPYLSDSVARTMPEFHRILPVPISPGALKADLFLVTHDHQDHLDPETIKGYAYKKETLFVAPRLACEKLRKLGVSSQHIQNVDSGETFEDNGIVIHGIFAVPTSADVIDTTGYKVTFENGRSFYHSSDTGFSTLLLDTACHAEVLLVCINGKWGNLNPEQAVRLTEAVKPQYAIPSHYDLMDLNSENPELFKWHATRANCCARVKILKPMDPFVWSA